MTPQAFSFSIVLPLTQLTIWSLLVPTQVGYYFLLNSIGAKTGTMNFGRPSFHLLMFVLNGVADRYSHFIMAIDLPGLFGEGAVSLPTTWPSSWYPTAFTIWSWRAISWPFYALPFWWFAGRGFDSATGLRSAHWITLLIGSIFASLFVAAFFGFVFAVPASDRDADMFWIFGGVTLWTIAFSSFPYAWIKSGLQRRKRKKQLKLEAQLPQT